MYFFEWIDIYYILYIVFRISVPKQIVMLKSKLNFFFFFTFVNYLHQNYNIVANLVLSSYREVKFVLTLLRAQCFKRITSNDIRMVGIQRERYH
jgi:hypothetical protein